MMRKPIALILLVGAAIGAQAFEPNQFVPETSIEHRWDIGVRAHTNHIIYTGPEFYPGQEIPVLAELLGASHGPALGAMTGPSGFHPSDMQAAYGVSGVGGGTIAIVDAYDYPTALNDFNTFSGMFGLPVEVSVNGTSSSNTTFQVVYASGTKPTADGGWSQEMALDTQWAHAMAPGAKIVLVEAASSSFSSLLQAVSVAASLPGVTQVSMSWGGSEFGFESFDDSTFVKSGVTFFASTGDVGGSRNYPAMSPNVVAVGGTSLHYTGGVRTESGWSDSGGGPSEYERMPTYQDLIMRLVRGHRGVPDIAADADPSTGVAVYDSTAYQGFVNWFVVGGTSLSSPLCAGIANAGGATRGSNELAYIYSHSKSFNDITSGGSGTNLCKPGWDYVTGWGSPKSSSSL